MQLHMFDMRAGMLDNRPRQLDIWRRKATARPVNQPKASHHGAADSEWNKEQVINADRQFMQRLIGHDQPIALSGMSVLVDIPVARVIDRARRMLNQGRLAICWNKNGEASPCSGQA